MPMKMRDQAEEFAVSREMGNIYGHIHLKLEKKCKMCFMEKREIYPDPPTKYMHDG